MQDKTQIVAILDRSGSMQSIITDAIGGYNKFLGDQKKDPKPADLKVILFDNEYERHYAGALQQAPLMNDKSYVPRGSTALLDAIGRTIDEMGKELEARAEDQRPNRVLFIIMTDGEENASRHYTVKDIADKISHQRSKYNWEFIFLAANLDAIATASQYGIAAQNAINFVGNAQAIKGTYSVVSQAVSGYRGGAQLDSFLNCDVNDQGQVISRTGTGPAKDLGNDSSTSGNQN